MDDDLPHCRKNEWYGYLILNLMFLGTVCSSPLHPRRKNQICVQ